MLSVLSVLSGWYMLRFLGTSDVDTSWLDRHALRSDSPLPTTVSASNTISRLRLELKRITLFRCNFPCNRFKLNLKERATTNKLRCKPEQKQGGKAAAELPLNKSHATANVSLFARWQKLPTAALSYFHILGKIWPKTVQLHAQYWEKLKSNSLNSLHNAMLTKYSTLMCCLSSVQMLRIFCPVWFMFLLIVVESPTE